MIKEKKSCKERECVCACAHASVPAIAQLSEKFETIYTFTALQTQYSYDFSAERTFFF